MSRSYGSCTAQRRDRYECPTCAQPFRVVYDDDPALPHVNVTLGCPRCGDGIAVYFPAESAAIAGFSYKIEKLAS